MLTRLTTLLSENLIKRQFMLVTAESCTGGGLACALTEIAGASLWFERGFITYSNQAKIELLGLDKNRLETYGAVSPQTAEAMAEGALKHSHAHISVSITGIAGPEGGSPQKPVGTIFLGFASPFFTTQNLHCTFNGTRQSIREQTVISALQKLNQLTKE
jgi:nicotinamide-nucleotide amidase